MQLGDFKWTLIGDIKIGDKLSHWGNEDTVKEIVQRADCWEVTVFDALLQEDRTHQYKLSDELLVKQVISSSSKIMDAHAPRFVDHLSNDDLRQEIEKLEQNMSQYEGAVLDASRIILEQFKEELTRRTV